jgi:hypothetical protein
MFSTKLATPTGLQGVIFVNDLRTPTEGLREDDINGLGGDCSHQVPLAIPLVKIGGGV